MSCVFAVRSDSFNAHVSRAGKVGKPAGYGQLSGQSAFLPAIVSDAAAIGGTTFDMADNAEVAKVILWPGFDNCPSSTTRNITVAIRVRFQTYAINQRIWMLGSAFNLNSISLSGTLGTSFRVEATDGTPTACISSFNAAHGLSSTANYNDIVVTWDGTTTANSLKVYVNGSSITSQTPAAAWAIAPFCQSQIIIGGYPTALNASRMFVNEFLIFDEVLDASTIASAFSGTARSSFYSVTASDGITWPTVSKVRDDQTWNEFGVAKAGTLTLPATTNVKSGIQYGDAGTGSTGSLVSTDPGAENVVDGIEYTIENVDWTGGYQVPESIDPGVENVLDGITYKINDASLEGTFDPNLNFANMRQFLNDILREIGCSSLTDDEYATTTGLDDEYVYSVEVYEALDQVLITRGDVNSDREKLEHYFLARGTELNAPVEDDEIKTKILMGVALDDVPAESTGNSNLFLGGPLE